VETLLRSGKGIISMMKHSNGNNAVFANWLRKLEKDKVLIDQVVVRDFLYNKQVVLCQKCYVVAVILFKDDVQGEETIRFNTNKDANRTAPSNVECQVHQIEHLWI
jgi:hypothetical protein